MAAWISLRKRWIIGITLSALFVCSLSAVWAAGYPARQGTYINDYAHLLPPDVSASIQAMLAELQRTSDIEMSVVTINSISEYGTGDPTIESFATRLFNRWGLGNALTDKGVLFLVAVKDRKVRIELGDGYDSSYNKKAQDVLNEFVLPAFKNGDFVRGIDKGVKGTIHAVTGSWPPGAEPTIFDNPNLPGILGVGGLVGLGLIGFGALYYYNHKCPMCGKSGLYIATNVLVYPTYGSEGEKEVRRECPGCGFHDTRIEAIPMRHYTTSSSSDSGGSSSSSSGSSDSGGSSSGGGATGSW
ncbi:MAG: TPM domain-containing protein [Anaerolineae bacterium]|nr:TPM domain-containing protein [Anaerolineae bacterium]